jgi:hypothetical protein
MVYDKAEWHYDGDYPEDLPDENGATHIGMFLAWIVLHKLEGELQRDEWPEALAELRARRITGRDFLMKQCDGALGEDELSPEGNDFAAAYYASDQYLNDYTNVLGGDLPTLYHVTDSWENYDIIARVIDRRFKEWKAEGSSKPA